MYLAIHVFALVDLLCHLCNGIHVAVHCPVLVLNNAHLLPSKTAIVGEFENGNDHLLSWDWNSNVAFIL